MSKYVLNPPTTQNTDPRYVSEGLGQSPVLGGEIRIPTWLVVTGAGFAWYKWSKKKK